MDDHPEVGFTYGKVIKTSDLEPEPCRISEEYNWMIIPGREFMELCCTGNSMPRTSFRPQQQWYALLCRRSWVGIARTFPMRVTWRCGCVWPPTVLL